MKILLLLLTCAVLAAAPARAEGPLDPGDDKWNQQGPRGDPGKLSVQGGQNIEGSTSTWPIPLWVSAPATLLVAAGGFALSVPQMSIDHVFGFRSGFSRPLGFGGLALVAIAPAIGFGLSGGGIGTIITGTLIEAALVGASFGGGYLANLARSEVNHSLAGRIAVNDVLGIGLVVIEVILMVGAVVFPIMAAFMSGDALDQEDKRALAPLDAVGFMPTRGGAVFSAAWTIP